MKTTAIVGTEIRQFDSQEEAFKWIDGIPYSVSFTVMNDDLYEEGISKVTAEEMRMIACFMSR